MLSDDVLLRLPDVTRRAGISRSTLYQYISSGRFPAPVRVGARAVRWRASDVSRWLESLTKTTEGPKNAVR